MFASICLNKCVALLKLVSQVKRFLSGKDPLPVPVYDIVNAGPRRRFQAGPLVVSNCQYGAGGAQFRHMAKIMCGIDMTIEVANQTVQDYRDSNPLIVELWEEETKRLQDATVRYLDIEVELATGRKIRYMQPKRFARTYDKKINRVPTKVRREFIAAKLTPNGRYRKLYGPKLVQARTQGNGREVLAIALNRCYDCWLNVALHVHDEIILVSPDKRVEEDSRALVECMTEPMDGFEGLPLAVGDIEVTDHYQK